MDGWWVDGQMDGCMHGWKEGWMDGKNTPERKPQRSEAFVDCEKEELSFTSDVSSLFISVCIFGS